ncbi:MAG: hypothetical protein ACN6NT_06075 [Comamonas sp.]
MNYLTTYERRFFALLKIIEQQPRCSNRQEAHDQLLKVWILVCQEHLLPKGLIEKMFFRSLSAQHGWHDLDKDPCYWDSKTSPGVRIYLHDNGEIVIQRINDAGQHEILFHKKSAIHACKKSTTPL